MIPHPNPITVDPSFSGTWITSVRIAIGSSGIVSHVRYNGAHTLNERPVFVTINLDDLSSIESIIIAEAKRLFDIEELNYVSVQSNYPNRPIRIIFGQRGKRSYVISDAYELAAKDSVFAEAFQSIMDDLGNIINN
jgi:hypothetical protein